MVLQTYLSSWTTALASIWFDVTKSLSWVPSMAAKNKKKLVRQSKIVQSVIYCSDTVVTQVLTHAVLSLGSQPGLFPFAEYEWTKTW